MAYRVSMPALPRERVTRRVRVEAAFTPDGRVPRRLKVEVFTPYGAQQGAGGGGGGTQLNRGLN